MIYKFGQKIFYLIGLIALKGMSQNPNNQPNDNHLLKQSIYDFKIVSITGDTLDFSIYKGKKILIVNTASKCGYTPQYSQLQELHIKYGDKVSVLGFPANNFGSQEPGTNSEIENFCQSNYGVTFQLFQKVSVKGEDQSSLFKWLTDKNLNGWNNESVKWNFTKFLIDENGNLSKVFLSKIKPLSEEIINAIIEPK